MRPFRAGTVGDGGPDGPRVISKTSLIMVKTAQWARRSIDRCVVKLKYREEDPLSVRSSGRFSGHGAPKRDNRLGDKLHLLRFVRPAGNVPLAALPGLETVAPDIARPVRSKGR